MSLQAILERIRAAGEAQTGEILEQARREAQQILDDAQADANQSYHRAYRDALEPSAGECARIRNAAVFEANCLSGQLREAFIQSVFDCVRQQMTEIRQTAGYRQALQGILTEVLPANNGVECLKDRVVLEADPRDRDLLQDLLRSSGLDVPVCYTLNCWGGLIARAPDGTWKMTNTLESRLERAMPYLRQQIAAWLEKQTQPARETRPIEEEKAAPVN